MSGKIHWERRKRAVSDLVSTSKLASKAFIFVLSNYGFDFWWSDIDFIMDFISYTIHFK